MIGVDGAGHLLHESASGIRARAEESLGLEVSRISTSMAGSTVAVILGDGTLRVFRRMGTSFSRMDIGTHSLKTEDSWLQVAADGMAIVAGDLDRMVSFDLASNQELVFEDGPLVDRRIVEVVPSPSARFVAFLYLNADRLEVWSANGLRVLGPIEVQGPEIAFSLDGSRLYVAEWTRFHIRVLDLWGLHVPLPAWIAEVQAVAACPNGTTFAVAEESGNLAVLHWDGGRGLGLEAKISGVGTGDVELDCSEAGLLVVENDPGSVSLYKDPTRLRDPIELVFDGVSDPVFLGATAGETLVFGDGESGELLLYEALTGSLSTTEVQGVVPEIGAFRGGSGVAFLGGQFGSAVLNIGSDKWQAYPVESETVQDYHVSAAHVLRDNSVLLAVPDEQLLNVDAFGRDLSVFDNRHWPIATAIDELPRTGDLVTAGFDGQVTLWRGYTVAQLADLIRFASGNTEIDVAVPVDSNVVFAGDMFSTVALVDLTVGGVVRALCSRVGPSAHDRPGWARRAEGTCRRLLGEMSGR